MSNHHRHFMRWASVLVLTIGWLLLRTDGAQAADCTWSGTGATTIAAGAPLTLNDGPDYLRQEGRAISTAGTATWTTGSGNYWYLTDGAVFTSQAGVTFNAQANEQIMVSGSSNRFNNLGTFTREGEGTSVIQPPFDNISPIQVSKWHTAPTDAAYMLRWENSAGLRFCLGNGAQLIRANSGQPDNDGQWHHVVGMWDGATATIYVDGAPRGSTAAQAFGLIQATTRAVVIGSDANGNVDRFFNGLIDEVAIFGRALTADAIADLYQEGSPGWPRTTHGVCTIEADLRCATEIIDVDEVMSRLRGAYTTGCA